MVGSDENAGQPWRQFHARVHIMRDQHSRAEQCATGERDYDCRYFPVATRCLKSGGACLERIARPQIRPLVVMPLCKGRKELLVVCKIADFHGCARQFSRRDGVQLPSTLKTKVRTFSVVATKCWVSWSDWLGAAVIRICRRGCAGHTSIRRPPLRQYPHL